MYVTTWFPLSSPEFPPPFYLPPLFIDIIVVTVVIPAIAAALILLLFWVDVPVDFLIITVFGSLLPLLL